MRSLRDNPNMIRQVFERFIHCDHSWFVNDYRDDYDKASFRTKCLL